jgi:hypothetical protein
LPAEIFNFSEFGHGGGTYRRAGKRIGVSALGRVGVQRSSRIMIFWLGV